MALKIFQWRSIKTRVTLLTLTIFMASVWAITFYVSRVLHKDMLRVLGEQQFSTASYVAAVVNDELNNRLNALNTVAEQIEPTVLGNTADLQKLIEQRPILASLFSGSVWVSRQDGIAIASLMPELIGTSYADREYLITVLKEGKSAISKPITGKVMKDAIFVMAVPIRDGQGQVIGAFAGVTDLGRPNFLDKLSGSRYGQTGSYFIVAPQHRIVIASSDKNRVMQPLPAPGVNPMIDRFVQGYEGYAVLVNAVGKEVLSSSKLMPLTGWAVSISLPTEEAFAPIREMEQRALNISLILTLLTGCLIWFVISKTIQRQLSPMLVASRMLATMCDTDQPPQLLPVSSEDEIGELIGGFNRLLDALGKREQALIRSENELKKTQHIAQLGSWYLDLATNQVVWTEELYKMYGLDPSLPPPSYTEHPRLLTPESWEMLSSALAKTRDTGVPYELELETVRENGHNGWIWVRGETVTDEGGKIVGIWGAAQDITERKQFEEALNEANVVLAQKDALLRSMLHNLPFDFWARDIHQNILIQSKESVRMWGDLTGTTMDEVNVAPEYLAMWKATNARVLNGEILSNEQAYDVCGEQRQFHAIVAPILLAEKVQGILGINIDITESKQAESALKLVAESSLLSVQDIFPFLVRKIAITQGMRYAMIARLDSSGDTAHTVAVWCGDRYGENFSYTLEGTPCNNVVSGGACFYPSNVQVLFPHDQLLVDMGIESYWGTVLRTSTGELLGVMAVMHDQPIEETSQTHALLQAFALRTSVEMERQQNEILLRKNQEDLKKAQHIAKLGNWSLNLKNNHIVWSDELYLMYGLDPTLPPPPYTELTKLFTPESWERLSTAMQHTSETGIAYDLELETTRIDGSHGWMWMYGEAVVDVAKEIVGLRGVAQDITDRKLAEGELRALEERFRLTFYTSPDAVNINKMDGTYVEINEGFADLTGFTREDVIGKTSADINIWDIPEDRVRLVEGLQRDGYVRNLESRFLMKDGSCKIALMSAAIIQLKGEPHILSVTRDVTSLKKAEEDKLILERQLQQAQKMEAIGTLAGGIAHDFNNILGAILGYAEMVQEDSPAGSSMRKDIDQVVKASLRAKDLVKQILAFSRQAESDRIPLQPAIIIKEALKLLRASLPTTIAIQQDIDQKAGPLLADPTQIHQIMVNLCTNAFHAMEEKGGVLAIALQNRILTAEDLIHEPHVSPGRFVQLSIGDNGPGITPEIRKKIFDPYFTTKEVGKGTGMGLAIVHGIVRSYNGFITCLSTPGEGTVFQVLLPIIEDQAGIIVEAAPPDIAQLGNESILFIDDEEILAEMGKTMLERLGYFVTVRRNSLEALKTFQSQPDQFDLVITDQTMPGMTGIDMARRMLQIRPGMPIILCTGYSSLISEDKAKSLGIKGFAMKPLSKKNIAKLIREILDGKRAAIVNS